MKVTGEFHKAGGWTLLPTTFGAAQCCNTQGCLPGAMVELRQNNRHLRMDSVVQIKLSVIIWDALGYSIPPTSASPSGQSSFVGPGLYASACGMDAPHTKVCPNNMQLIYLGNKIELIMFLPSEGRSSIALYAHGIIQGGGLGHWISRYCTLFFLFRDLYVVVMILVDR